MEQLWYVAAALAAVLTVSSFLISVPETSWEREKVAEDIDERFIDAEIVGSNLNIIYRPSQGGGVELKKKSLEIGVSGALSSVLSDEWVTETIDSDAGTGAYISAENISGELVIAYQDASIGSERVVLASKSSSDWTTETVDDVVGSGVNVGMYTSLTSYNGDPLVLYHSPVEGLAASRKTDGGWSKENLADDMGWFTDSVSCTEKAYIAYRGRDSKSLKIAEFNREWNIENLTGQVKSSIAVDEKNCQLHLVYLSEDEEIIYRSPNDNREKLADSDYSDASIDVGENIQVVYYNYGTGLFHAEKTEKGWEEEKLGNASNTDRHNSLAVDGAGNPHVIFTQNSDLIHAEYNQSRTETLTTLINASRGALLLVFGLLLLQSYRIANPELLNKLRARN